MPERIRDLFGERASGSDDDQAAQASHALFPDLPARPHLVFLITDQERYPQHWPEGWADAHLPNRKRLADTGLSFTNACCNSCMCSPSRSTLYTSLYPAQHGVTETLTDAGTYSGTEVVLAKHIPNIAKVLRKAGYKVTFKGKWHLIKPGQGTDSWTDNDIKAVANYGFDDWDPPDAGEDTAPEHFGGGLADNDGRYVNDAVEFLKTVDPSEPFALFISLVNPHDVLAYPKSYDGNYDPNVFTTMGIELPPTIDEDLSTKPSCQSALHTVLALGLGPLSTTERKLDYVNFYAYLHTVVDQQIGAIIDALEAPRGNDGALPSLRDQTLVVRTSDHGEMGLSHGGLRQKAFNVYKESLRVPLVFSNPRCFPTPRTSEALVSLIDVLPTLAHLIGVDSPRWQFRGVDLMPLLLDTQDEVQSMLHFTFDDQRAGAANMASSVPQPNHIRCIHDHNWKYAIYFDPTGQKAPEYEMYDLRTDPNETTNLAHSTDEDVVAQRARLHAELLEHMDRKGTYPLGLELPEVITA